IAQRVHLHAVDLAGELAPFFVEESGAVRNQELRIANLRAIDGGIVDLSQNTLTQREPDPAGGGISGSDAIFGTSGPSRWNPGLAKGMAGGLRRVAGHYFVLLR